MIEFHPETTKMCLQMDWYPNKGEVSCECSGENGLTFANSFYVAPNTIDFSTVFLKFSPKDQAPFWQYLFSSLSCMLYWWFGAVIKIKRTSSRYAWYFHILHFKKKLGWPWLFWLILIFLWRKHQFYPINIQTYKNIFIFEGKKKLNFSFIKTLFMPEELIHKSLR